MAAMPTATATPMAIRVAAVTAWVAACAGGEEPKCWRRGTATMLVATHSRADDGHGCTTLLHDICEGGGDEAVTFYDGFSYRVQHGDLKPCTEAACWTPDFPVALRAGSGGGCAWLSSPICDTDEAPTTVALEALDGSSGTGTGASGASSLRYGDLELCPRQAVCWLRGSRVMLNPESLFGDQNSGCGVASEDACQRLGFVQVDFDDGYSNVYRYEDLLPCSLTLLFSANGQDAAFVGSWPGWRSAGPPFAEGGGDAPGKRLEYDAFPIGSLRFADATGAFAEYSLEENFTGRPLLDLVQRCMPAVAEEQAVAADVENSTWPGGICTAVAWLTSHAGLNESNLSPFLRLGVGDGTGSPWGWALFMPLRDGGGLSSDLSVAADTWWAFGAKSQTNPGFSGPVYIYGCHASTCLPAAVAGSESTTGTGAASASTSTTFVVGEEVEEEEGLLWLADEGIIFVLAVTGLCGLLLIITCMLQLVMCFKDSLAAQRARREARRESRALEAGEKGAALDFTGIVPEYWNTSKSRNGPEVSRLIYVGAEHHKLFDELLEKTYEAKATQDRPCPRGSCARTQGGCRCVQPGADPGLPVGYRVRRVLRVEDSRMWSRYLERRRAIASRRCSGAGPWGGPSEVPRLDPPAVTDRVATGHPAAFEALRRDLNEAYLWHGTSVRNALAIAQDHFKVDLAGTGRGTMYGRGTYLAESSTKADEYSADEAPGGYYAGAFALLLCRAALGRIYYTTTREEDAARRVHSGEFDSVLGDRAKRAGTFREFVLYDTDQVYPEYIILYTRVMHSDPPSLLATPLNLELPIYWANCHRNPRTDTFCKLYDVQLGSSYELLQRLVEGACTKEGRRLTLQRARRVEHAALWNRHAELKRRLREELQRQRAGRFPPAEELSRDLEQGPVLTQLQLEAEPLEAAMSAAHLDVQLNEHLLWHGTTKEAAEAIVATDFRMPDGVSQVAHGLRFGRGAYFAEDLAKSVQYAAPGADRTRHLLLCRVLCGGFYYTEAKQEPGAPAARDRAGKHCVLANPQGQGPREFVVPDVAQVYPEYILEVKVD